jgi:hypothetical protein
MITLKYIDLVSVDWWLNSFTCKPEMVIHAAPFYIETLIPKPRIFTYDHAVYTKQGAVVESFFCKDRAVKAVEELNLYAAELIMVRDTKAESNDA